MDVRTVLTGPYFYFASDPYRSTVNSAPLEDACRKRGVQWWVPRGWCGQLWPVFRERMHRGILTRGIGHVHLGITNGALSWSRPSRDASRDEHGMIPARLWPAESILSTSVGLLCQLGGIDEASITIRQGLITLRPVIPTLQMTILMVASTTEVPHGHGSCAWSSVAIMSSRVRLRIQPCNLLRCDRCQLRRASFTSAPCAVPSVHAGRGRDRHHAQHIIQAHRATV